jgi:GntR family transcriptional regulator
MRTGDGVPDPVAGLRLDRSSPVPLHRQVAQWLEAGIASGRLPPGTRLDNEVALADSLGLSRPTLRQAMRYLVEKGLIVRRRGAGTRVGQPLDLPAPVPDSSYDELRRAHQEPTTRVLSLATGPADADTARTLAVPVGSAVLTVERLRAVDGAPIARLTNWLRVGLLDLDAGELEHTGLYATIRDAGIDLHAARQVIGGRAAAAEEAELLGIEPGGILLTMQRTTYDQHGTPVEHGRHVYVAARWSFEMSLLTP